GKRLDIGLRKLLVKKLIADSTRGVAGTAFLRAPHCAIYLASCNNCAGARAACCARGSQDAAQPTQSRYSKPGFTSTVGTSRPSAQASRSELGRPYGLDCLMIF